MADIAIPPRRSRKKARPNLSPWLMLAPAIVLFVAFMAAPIVYTLYLSFQKAKVEGLGLGPNARTQVFAGFENYIKALSDPDFFASVGRVLVYGLILVPALLGLALLFALLLDSRRTRLGGFSRLAIFLPYAVPSVIASLIWGFLYLPAVSPFYYLAEQAGWQDPPEILGKNLILFAVANIALWGGVGFNMVVIYTALRSIPTELYEAARIDGATEVQIALRIKLPIVLPSIILTSLFSVIWTLQVFNEPNTLQPLSVTIDSAFTPLMKIYRDAFVRNDIYTASATSIVIALATFALSFGFLRLIQRRAFAQEESNR